MEVNEGSSRGPPPPVIRRHQPRPPTVERNPSSSAATSTTPAGSAAPPPPRPPPHLRIRVLNLQQRHRDLCVQLDATTNLPSYRRSHYPPFTRTLRELAQFALSLSVHVPTHILAALPLPTPGLIAATTLDGPTIGSSAPPPVHPTSLPEGRLFCYHLSRWLSRLVAEPAHRDHAETRNFVEAEYSYHPIEPMEDHGGLPLVAKRWHALTAAQAASDRAAQAAGAGAGMTIDVGVGFGLPSGVVGTTVGGPSTSANGSSGGSGFLGSLLGGSKSNGSSSSTGTGGKGLSLSRNVHDDDEDLVSARMEVTRLELQFGTAAQKGQAVVSARSQRLSTSTAALCNALHTWSGLEATRPLCAAAGLPKHLETLARGLSGPLEGVSRASCQTEGLTMLYQLAYQGKNAKAAKEALLARNALVEEQYEASKRALVKKREVEHLKVKMGSQAAQHHGHGGSSTSSLITRDRIEVAIDDFTESARYAGHLRELLADLSGKMHDSLRAHSRCAHADVKQALQEHARGSVGNLKREMRELRRLRGVLRGEVVEGEEVAERREGVVEGEEEGEEESVAAMGRSEEVASPPARASPTSPSSSAAVPAAPTRHVDQDQQRGSPAPSSAAMSPSPSSDRPQQQQAQHLHQQQHLQQHQHLQRPYGTPTATPPRTLSPSPYASPPPSSQQQRQPPTATATQSMFLPRPQRDFEEDDEAEDGRRAFAAAAPHGGLNTSRFAGGSAGMMSNSVSALPPSSGGRDSPAAAGGLDDPFASSTTSPPSTTFGTMPRSGAGFGTMGPSRGGRGGGRGGRISAAEAARSLAGRF